MPTGDPKPEKRHRQHLEKVSGTPRDPTGCAAVLSGVLGVGRACVQLAARADQASRASRRGTSLCTSRKMLGVRTVRA